MKHNNEIDFFRAVLMGLVIIVHTVNFGHIYPLAKSSILAFMMPTFLLITGYLVNIEKSFRGFALYILKIWILYMVAVLGYAIVSLYLPVRDGIEVFDAPTVLHILFFKPLGPYWFFHTMMVCGVIYYFSFHLFRKLGLTARYSVFASLLIAVSLFTPFLNLKAATYYFIGAGIRQYAGDFSKIYKKVCGPLSLLRS